MDEFCDAFIEWLESKGWFFGGGLREYVDGRPTLPEAPDEDNTPRE